MKSALGRRSLDQFFDQGHGPLPVTDAGIGRRRQQTCERMLERLLVRVHGQTFARPVVCRGVSL